MVDAMERPPCADHGITTRHRSIPRSEDENTAVQLRPAYGARDPHRSSDTSLPIALAKLENPLSFTHSTKVFVIIGVGRSDGLNKHDRRVVTGKDRGSSNLTLP